MTEPNPYLSELYGTDKIAARAKAEGMPTAVRLAAALMGFGLMMHSEGETDEVQERARMIDEIGRRMEEARMRPLLESMGKQGAVQHAFHSGQYLAKLAAGELSEMQKEALGFGAVGGAVKRVGRLLKRKPQVPNMRGTGAQAPITMSAPGTMGAPAGPVPSLRAAPSLKPGTTEMATTGTALARRPAARPPTKSVSGKVTPGAAQGGKPGNLKGTLIGAGLLGAGGLGTVQAAQAAKDYMMVPSQQTQRWGYGARAPATVNPYGYASY